jgi:hypothetical protein
MIETPTMHLVNGCIVFANSEKGLFKNDLF